MRKSLAFCAIVVCASAAVADAQTLRPSRPYRGLFGGGPPPDPDRTRHELTVTASLLGGYDDVVSVGRSPRAIESAPVQQSGYTGFGDATLSYWFGRQDRFLSVLGNAFASHYSSKALDVNGMVGGSATIQAQTALGRRNQLSGFQSVGLDPTLVLGGFDSLQAEILPSMVPETAGLGGLLDQRSVSTNSSVTLRRDWTRRQSTSTTYGYVRRNYLDDLGFDSSSHRGTFRYSWAFARTTSLDATYGATRRRLIGSPQNVVPSTDHSVHVGFTHARSVSPTRQIRFSGGAGATYVNARAGAATSVDKYWIPSGYAGLSLDLGRSWALSADYRRAVSALTGVTLDTFTTHAASVRADGLIGRRIEVALSTALSTGKPGVNPLGDFEIYSGVAQFRYAIARCCAVSANYNYYYYNVRDVADPAYALLADHDRHSVRVGLTFLLPLYGAYVDRGAGAAAKR